MNCVTCGCETTNPKFCSRSCAAKTNSPNQRKRVRTARLYNCLECSNPIVNAGKKFCSLGCSSIYRWKTCGYEGGARGSQSIRRYLLRTQEHVCSVCSFSEWQGEPIPLEVDHIDGNSDNNDLSNLHLLCPNCHALTPTYKNRNKGNGRHYRRVRYANGQSY